MVSRKNANITGAVLAVEPAGYIFASAAETAARFVWPVMPKIQVMP